MATISEILALENESQRGIHLYREGIFWKAYQESAYLVLQQSGKFKVSKKYVKSVDREVVSIGFPDITLSKLYMTDQLTERGEKQLFIDCERADMPTYQAWFDSIEITEKQEKTAPVAAYNENRQATNNAEAIIRRLREFRLEDSSPLDCMLFLVSIRNELDPR